MSDDVFSKYVNTVGGAAHALSIADLCLNLHLFQVYMIEEANPIMDHFFNISPGVFAAAKILLSNGGIAWLMAIGLRWKKVSALYALIGITGLLSVTVVLSLCALFVGLTTPALAIIQLCGICLTGFFVGLGLRM